MGFATIPAWAPSPREFELLDPTRLHTCPTGTPGWSHHDPQPAPQQPPATHSILQLDAPWPPQAPEPSCPPPQ